MEERKIWENVVLKDGKLLFWRTGNEKYSICDFSKDFYTCHLRMIEEIASGRFAFRKRVVNGFDDDSFYRNFELHEDFKGRRPYEGNPRRVGRIPGIFCLNSGCKHYFEDNCTNFFQNHTLSISKNGMCAEFEERENKEYGYCDGKEDNQRD